MVVEGTCEIIFSICSIVSSISMVEAACDVRAHHALK